MILDCVRAEKIGEMGVWSENLGYINKGMELLKGVAEGPPIFVYRVAAVNKFLKSLQRY